MKRTIISLFALIAYFALSAQNTFYFRFDVIDEFSKEEIDSDLLMVDVMESDSAIIVNNISFDEFTDLNFRKRPLIIRLYMEGFQDTIFSVSKPGARIDYLYLDKIILKRDLNAHKLNKKLDELVVQTSVVKMVHRGDTVIYNADAFQLSEGSMLDELVRLLPGVELKKGGRLYYNGRFIDNLLLNGKDFFKGDATVALSNLPSFMVNNIKVYEQDSFISRVDPTSEKPLVLDVGLKKEYSVGLIANTQIGYGTENKYIGKIFGLTFRPTSRLSLMANVNNTNDTSSPDDEGDWISDLITGGRSTTHKAGLDYSLYDKDNLWELNSNVSVIRNRTNKTEEENSDIYIEEGTLTRNSFKKESNNSYELLTNHHFKYETRRLSFSVAPTFRLSIGEDDLLSEAEMWSSGELINADNRSKRTKVKNLYGSIDASGMWAIPNTPDHLILDIKGHYQNNRIRNNGEYRISFTDPGLMSNSQMFKQYDPTAQWRIWAKTAYSGRTQLRGNLTKFLVKYEYEYSHDNADREYLTHSDSFLSTTTQESERAYVLDLNNTYESVTEAHSHIIQLDYIQYYKSLSITLSPKLRYSNRWLNYNQKATSLNIKRKKMYFEPSINFYSRLLSIDYSINHIEPNMLSLVDIIDDTNPMFIRSGNNKLRTSTQHHIKLTASILEDLLHSSVRPIVNFGFSYIDRAISQSSTYDITSGVTKIRPINVSGNWRIDGKINAGYYFDKSRKFLLTTKTSGVFTHSITQINLRNSVVNNTLISEQLDLSIDFKHGISFHAIGNLKWHHASSTDLSFQNLNAFSFNYGINILAAKLPWDISASTELTMHSQRGYLNNHRKDNHLVWNANISKSILKGKLIFKIDGVDILGQLSPIDYDINAQGYTEIRYNTIPRYVMLNVIYRFNLQPKRHK